MSWLETKDILQNVIFSYWLAWGYSKLKQLEGQLLLEIYSLQYQYTLLLLQS
jgi:hypothetical protein